MDLAKTPPLAGSRPPASSSASPDPGADAQRRRGTGLMVGGGLLLGSLGLFLEEAGQHPLMAVWFRCAFGLLALTLWAVWRGRLGELRGTPRSMALTVLAGALVVLNWALFFKSITLTSIAVATVAFHVQPLWVLLFGMVWLREPVSALRLGAVLAALAGLCLATGLFDQSLGMREGFVMGVMLSVGGSLSYAAVTLMARQVRGLNSFALAWWQCAVGTLALAWWPLMHGWPPLAAWGWLAGLGVLHTALAYVVLYAGMQKLPAGQIALLQFVYPVSAIVLDALVYGRPLSVWQWGGVLLMGAALWVARPGPAGGPTREAP